MFPSLSEFWVALGEEALDLLLEAEWNLLLIASAAKENMLLP